MPSTAFESMLAATINDRSPEITDQLWDSHPLTALMRSKARKKVWTGGEQIEAIISVGSNTTVAARDYKTPIPLEEFNPLRTVSIAPRLMSGSMTIYDAYNDTNAGKSKILDFQDELINNAKQSFQDALALQLWQDGTLAGSESLHGLPSIFSQSNTYMGIDRAGTGFAGSGILNTWWWPKMGATNTNPFTGFVHGAFNTAGALTIRGGADGGIQGLYDACCENGGTDGPDFAITTLTLFNKLKADALFGATGPRYNEKMAQLGYPDNIQYNNMTIVWDRNCPTGYFYAMNSKYLTLRPLSAYANGVKTDPPERLAALGLRASTMLMSWRGNLTCEKPQRMGVLTAKTA
jgi:hypothetical protein